MTARAALNAQKANNEEISVFALFEVLKAMAWDDVYKLLVLYHDNLLRLAIADVSEGSGLVVFQYRRYDNKTYFSYGVDGFEASFEKDELGMLTASVRFHSVREKAQLQIFPNEKDAWMSLEFRGNRQKHRWQNNQEEATQ